MNSMNPRESEADPPQDLHPELESFRKDLEIRLEKERASLKEEQKRSLKRIEELSENSIVKAREEWSGYEVTLFSDRESFVADLREEMISLLSLTMQRQDLESLAKEAVERIIPRMPSQQERGSFR